MSGELRHLPHRGADMMLTKKQLAAHLKRSERWVELKVRDAGLPVKEATDRYGRRCYHLAAVEAWLKDGKPSKRVYRVSMLEQRVAALERRLDEMQRRSYGGGERDDPENEA